MEEKVTKMPKKKKAKKSVCGAELYIGDDYGDGLATICCQLDEGHDGPHQEIFKRNDTDVVIKWEIDEREICEVCGRFVSSPQVFWCANLDCMKTICTDCAIKGKKRKFRYYCSEECMKAVESEGKSKK